MRAQFRARIRVVLAVILLAALIILARLYVVQIVEGEEYASKSDRQFASGSTGLFDRGAIFFTRKDGTAISAATLATGVLAAINPQTLRDPEAAYAAITAVATTSLSREAFVAAADRKNQVYIEVAHHLSAQAGDAIAAKRLPGVEILKERWRYYPGRELAAQTLGIVAYGSGETLAGQTGLEAYYEDALARSGDALYKNFFATLFSGAGNLLARAKEARRGSLVTTIEPEVEARLVDDIATVHERYASKDTGGIIMDPATGEIIAIAAAPTYDANDFAEAAPATLANPLVEHVHEFGSIMKPLTMAAALDAGVVTPASTYTDTGCLTVNTERICNWDHKARGVIPIKEIIKQSLNVGASQLATDLGQDRFRSYFTKLFGEKTGIDLPAESGALLSNLSTREQVNYDTASFGQGIAMTPLQMIRALGALANGGAMVRPHLVKSIELESGIRRDLDWSGSEAVYSPEAVRETVTMMDELTDEVLAEGTARIPTMSVAAKTGTAQLTTPGGGYYEDRWFHSFVGFFPSYKPRFIILLYTEDPQGVQYASETLTSTFLDLVHFLIDYYDVPPDRGLSAGREGPATAS
jgi:cell division protein FtsI (penicillin-binding protein 3)/stage V sporulation protein D (sporulation-specific penicillin-binding protein)